MNLENLAMVMQPNVLRAENEIASTMQDDYKQARMTLQDIIQFSPKLFH
jgi:hypothetical protein